MGFEFLHGFKLCSGYKVIWDVRHDEDYIIPSRHRGTATPCSMPTSIECSSLPPFSVHQRPWLFTRKNPFLSPCLSIAPKACFNTATTRSIHDRGHILSALSLHTRPSLHRERVLLPRCFLLPRPLEHPRLAHD
jgi:hypothetical protein